MVKELTVKDNFGFTLWETRADKLLAEIEETVEEKMQQHANEGNGDMWITDIQIIKDEKKRHPVTDEMIPEHYHITVEYEYEKAERFDGERNDYNG